jgi:molybdate-binding protein
MYPVEANGLGLQPADGVFAQGELKITAEYDPSRTLVLACCDPAVGLLAHELMKSHGVRLMVIPRSSGAALKLLQQGLVHLAGVHLAGAEESGNASVVLTALGSGYRLIRLTRWQAGLAVSPGRRIRSVRGAIGSNMRWVGREVGSGARQCLDELLGKKATFRRLAYDHRGVAEAIRCGWAEVGVSLQLTTEEAGLDFLGVREEMYDLCYSAELEGDPRLAALLQVIRSTTYRSELGALPGYDTSSTGAIEEVL